MKKFTVAFLLILLLSCPTRAETIFAVTAFRDLISFDSAAPGAIANTTPITGLVGQSSFESVVAIDFRPANNQLYALGNAPGNIYRLYTINTTTGAATQVGADTSIFIGSFFGFDFNPSVDLLRIVTDTDQNFRFNPPTGALVNTDSALAYGVGDANAIASPNIVGSAYSNNVAGAPTTTLYNIDSTLDILTTQNPVNNGTLNTVGPLGVDFSSFVGFDISGSGLAYASWTDPQLQNSQLYTINLTTGAATLVGAIGANLLINDIAVNAVPEPAAMMLVGALLPLALCRRCNVLRPLG